MKNNDDMLTRQGDVYTLVDKDGYLVREDTNGERKKYLLEGEGGGELPENLVNTFNTFAGDIDYPKFVYDNNSATGVVNFSNKNYLGELVYFKNPVHTLSVFFQRPKADNVKYFKDKYVIVKTSELFNSVTVTLPNPTDETLSPWVTNKEFVVEPNKTYLISCNYPLATIVELENVEW